MNRSTSKKGSHTRATAPSVPPLVNYVAALPGWQKHLLAAAVIVSAVLIYMSPKIEHGAFRPPDDLASANVTQVLRDWHDQNETVPQWTPLIFSGMPSYGSMVYVPSHITLSVVNWFANRGIRFAFVLSVGGIALYGLLVRNGIGPAAAVLGSLVFVCTPYFPGLAGAGHNQKIYAAAYVPLLLLSLDYLWRSRSLLAFAITAAAFGVQLAAKHPQVTYYAYILIGIWWVSRLVIALRSSRDWSKPLLELGLLTGVVVVAIAMVALPYLPIMEYTPFSVRGTSSVLASATGHAKGASWEFATQWSFHPKELISFVMPAFYGLKGSTYWGYMQFTQSTHYLGLVPLILVLFIRRPISPLIWACGAYSIVALVIGFGNHFSLLYRPLYLWAPYFSKFRIPSMIYMMLPLSVGILAAFGAQAVEDGSRGSKPVNWSSLALSPVGVIVALFVGMTLWAVSLSNSSAIDLMNRGLLLREEMRGNLLRDFGARLPQVYPQLYRNYPAIFGERTEMLKSTSWTAALWFGVAAIVLVLRRKKLVAGIVGTLIFLGATVADIWHVDWMFWDVPKTPAKGQFAENETVNWFRSDPSVPDSTTYRLAIFTRGGLDNTNYYGYFGLQSITGYHPIQLRIYKDLWESGALTKRPVLDMLSTRYLIAQKKPSVGDDITLVHRGRVNSIWLNPTARPKAWLVWDTQVVPEALAQIKAISSSEFDPATSVVVGAPITALAQSGSGTAKVTETDLHYISVDVTTDSTALLVSSEIFYSPTWTATIDGEDAPILRVNYVLRGIVIPPGSHTVEFIMSSESYDMGWSIMWGAILATTGLGVIAGALTLRRRHYRRKDETEVGVDT